MTSENAAKREALDRVVLEIDALTNIFCQDGTFDEHREAKNFDKNFFVTTPESLERSRRFVDQADWFPSCECKEALDVPRIDVESFIRAQTTDPGGDAFPTDGVRLRMSLPPGYPTYACAEVTVLSIPKKIPRCQLDELSTRLQSLAKKLIGSEAILEIINECREMLTEWGSRVNTSEGQQISSKSFDQGCHGHRRKSETESIGRRWIWVHHITNADRLKQIVIEARNLNLGGYVKGGYPGVIVAEGSNRACDKFVVWIKGSKSRPGGFGRNWGHHVRGEASVEKRQFPEMFEEVVDDMGKLGALCKEFVVEDEFRKFILQHNK